MTTQTTNMSTQEVANRFNELAQQGKYDVIQSELFSEAAISTEPEDSAFESVQGLSKIQEKAKAWQESTEQMHNGYCSQPLVAGNYFTVSMGMDVTIKEQGRMKMDEIAVYEVKEGKIVSEQFFYHTEDQG